MVTVEVGARNLGSHAATNANGGDEELRTVGVGARVSHGKETRSVVAHTEVLIGELSAVDGLTSITIEILRGEGSQRPVR